jgi:hypothetical protein
VLVVVVATERMIDKASCDANCDDVDANYADAGENKEDGQEDQELWLEELKLELDLWANVDLQPHLVLSNA